MVLAQDQAQASQAEAIIAEQEYQQDLVQYEKDQAQYEKDLVKYEKEKKKLADSQAAEAKRVADIKSTELKRKAAIESARIAEAKRVADIETARVAKLQSEAQARQTTWVNFWDNYTGNKGKAMKPVHYMSVGGVGFGTGDLVASIGSRGKIGIGAHSSYYERASASLSASYGVTVTTQQARQISATGARTMSGKAKERVTRSIIDPSGKMESDYQASRAQAKKNVASAYGSMSAQEASTSSALATNPEAQNKAKLEVLHNLTSGLIGKETTTTNETVSAYTIENARQTAYVNELRAGNISMAEALLQPQTTQQYSAGNTINLKAFLTERGYDISKPETIPDRLFKPGYSEPLTEARKQATKAEKENIPMGDLRLLSSEYVGKTDQPYKMAEASLLVQQKRLEARERIAKFDDKGSSFIGYGSDGSPIQGPPNISTQSQWVVTDPNKTTPTSIPTMMGKSYIVQTPVTYTFDTKEQAQGYIHHMNVSQGLYKVTEQKVNDGQYFADAYKAVDEFGKTAQADKGIGGTLYRGLTMQGGNPLGVVKMGLGAIIQIDNLATQNIAPWFSKVTGLNPQNQIPAAPLIQSSESADQTLIPYNFDQMRWQTGKEWTDQQLKYIKTYGFGDYQSGIVTGYWIGGKGLQSMSPIARNLIPTLVAVPSKTALGGTIQQVKNIHKIQLQVPPLISSAKEAIKTISPINVQRYDQVGVTLLESGGVVGVKPFTISVGYGEKSLPLLSKVGSSVQLGKPDIARSNIAKVVIDAAVQTDPKRGVKMAAGNTAYEQKLAPQLIPLVEGISKAEIRKAELIHAIQTITTSKTKDTMYRKSLPKNAFSHLTDEEAAQVIAISKKGQKARQDPIGPYEGSVSQPYFTAKEFMRKIGDFDFHSLSFEQGTRIIKRYEKIKASIGRHFIFPINYNTKSIKGISQTSVKVNYVDTAVEAERLNRANMKKATNVKFVDTDAYRLAQTRKYNLPADYFGTQSLFGQFQKAHTVLNQSRRLMKIPETVIIQKNAQINYSALTPMQRTKYLDEFGNFDNKAWQKTVIQHELIHKANPNLTETQVRKLADANSVDALGMTKAMKGSMERPLALPKDGKVDMKTGKWIEVLHPEQTDELGKAQVISGDTIFGKTIPTATYKVKEGITYGRQRQIVKKGESLYSLQKDESGNVTVSAYSMRSNKDAADFYALAESAQRIEDYSPKDKAKLIKLLDEFKESQKTNDFDVDEYLKNNAISKMDEDPVAITVGMSMFQKAEQKVGVITAYTTTPSIQSYRFIPSVKKETTPQTSLPSITSRINQKSVKVNVLSEPSISLVKSTTSRASASITSRVSTSRPSASRTSRVSTSRSSASITSRSSTSRSSTSRPSSSRSSSSRSSSSRSSSSRILRSKPSGSRSSGYNKLNSSTMTTKRRVVPGWTNVEESDKKTNKSKNKKTVDFLGNTRTDHIVGLFKRKEIISGDKASAKQLKKDKKWKKEKKKRRNVKNRSKSFGQRIGIVNKGFKI